MRSSVASPERSAAGAARSLFFAAGVVSSTTLWLIVPAANQPDMVPVSTAIAVALVALFQVVPMAALFAMGEYFRRKGLASRTRFRAAVLAGGAIFLMLHLSGQLLVRTLPILPRVSSVRWVALVVVIALSGVLGIWIVRRRAAFERHLAGSVELLGIVSIVTVGILAGMLHTDDRVIPLSYQLDAQGELAPATPGRTPVFVIVFDELSQNILLAQDGGIDATRYPNFARLAADGAEFSDMNANYFNTRHALPALAERLAGIAPVRTYLQYRVADLALAPDCGRAFDCRGVNSYIAGESSRIFKHLTLGMTTALIPQPWRAAAERPLTVLAAAMGTPTTVADPGGIQLLTEPHMDRLLNDLHTEDPRGSIYLIHTLSSHYPYVWDADGGFRSNPVGRDDDGLLTELGFQLTDPKTAADGRHGVAEVEDAYRDQIRYADRVLGRVLDQLDEDGWLDQSIIVVTADHGVRPELIDREPPRTVDDWVTRVPLIVRAPGLGPATFDQTISQLSLADLIAELLESPEDWGEVKSLRIATEAPPWFVVDGRWIYHMEAAGEWILVGERPSDRPVDRSDARCFQRPSDCADVNEAPVADQGE